MARMYRRKGKEGFVERMFPVGISAKRLSTTHEKWVVMVRPSLMRDSAMSGVDPNADDAWSWSLWRGYLGNKDGALISKWFADGDSRASHIHTSAHASPEVLQSFAFAINAKQLVLILGAAWDGDTRRFPAMRRLVDGETMTL